MKKKWVYLLGLIIFFLLAGFSFYWRAQNYRIVYPERANITEAVYGLGKVKSANRYEVIPGVISTVTKRYVNEGDVVEKGAPLIKLNEQTIFRAPFRGTVTSALLYEGETALPNVAVLRVEDLDQKYIELSLEQQAMLRVKINQSAQVSFESLRGKKLNGKVGAIFPRSDEFIVNVKVDGLEANILPGMTADVTIHIGEIKNALTLPIAAVKNGVIILKKEGRWKKVKADIGQIDGLAVEIKAPPLSEQDQIRIGNGG